MALSLEDKLLGEKVHNYCSSSEDEGEEPGLVDGEEESADNEEKISPYPISVTESPELPLPAGPQTGPKGVVADYKRYKKLEKMKRLESEKIVMQYAKEHALTSCTHDAEVLEKERDKALEDALGDIDDDEFLAQYRQNRIKELKKALESLPTYGKLLNLTAATFVEEIDNTPANTTVVIHVYELVNRACSKVNEYFQVLANEYPHVKFCNLKASDANLSYRFSHFGTPAILVYKKGELIGNLLSITRDLGSEFYLSDLENYLAEHGFLPDKTIGALLNARLNCRT